MVVFFRPLYTSLIVDMWLMLVTGQDVNLDGISFG